MKHLPFPFLFVLLFFACQSETKQEEIPPTVQFTTSALEHTIDLLALEKQQQLPPETQLSVQRDIVSHLPTTYTGHSLQEILATHFPLETIDTATATLVFVCIDGYAPTMPLQDAFKARALLATAIAGETQWRDTMQKYAPYYVVWEDTDTSVYHYPWPYALTEIKLTTAEAQFSAAIPPAGENAEAGFELFKNHCMKCHSVNKVGGVMGPEFNFPKNITEYWEVENIWAFVQNPQSFRYRSTMPAQADLKREEFEEIIAYLKVMKNHKLEE